jgi:hypothetical protein
LYFAGAIQVHNTQIQDNNCIEMTRSDRKIGMAAVSNFLFNLALRANVTFSHADQRLAATRVSHRLAHIRAREVTIRNMKTP